EYFTFRENLMFVQLNGLETITLPAGISHFTLEVVFSEVEYFTFRENLMFVQLNGLETITLPAGISHFTLE
ncbi:hypothetical protein CJ430_31565, partial [Klebsiella pneumoniae]